MDQMPSFKIRLSDHREFGPATMEIILQWAREGRVPIDSLLVNAHTGEVRSVLAEPMLARILQAPPTVSTGLVATQPDAPVLIPYRNPAALVGYYLAVFSILFFPLGFVAMILGVIGLVKRSRKPEIRGAAHAWVAILLGGAIAVGASVLIAVAIMNS